MTRIEATSRRRRPIAVASIAIGAAAILAIFLAAPRSAAADRETAPSPRATEYLPRISDLMIETIQPRHERLWRAWQDGSWDFAAYELGNLKGAFNRLGHAHPTQGNISLPDMITSVTEQPFNELGTAIQSKDGAAFAKAYTDLTDACNSCHQALNHGVVEIRVPNRTSTSDLGGTSAPRN
ncbi:cytochrome c [Bradyrhizobium cenepequi]|uniref:cytochrome c n=1 Tax=Bradyrhizobium cenepequi TaxID=2821403 RepID=UPI001CE2477A|nr:cytochrome c [Bradyrhizobium cenepequi]MCA6109350.1 cytochrome family protein [Bradyrhizobium cenepequi]